MGASSRISFAVTATASLQNATPARVKNLLRRLRLRLKQGASSPLPPPNTFQKHLENFLKVFLNILKRRTRLTSLHPPSCEVDSGQKPVLSFRSTIKRLVGEPATPNLHDTSLRISRVRLLEFSKEAPMGNGKYHRCAIEAGRKLFL